jgi:hypothetical protein
MEESSMRRLLWIVPLVIAVALTSYMLARPATAPADPMHLNVLNPDVGQPETTATSTKLPITQVVLYSSGVGYFQRDGQVDGNSRVDLAFPVGDINDLLKSMVLQDLDGGHVSAVGYDSHDPIDKTLNSFAIQLTNNPSHAQILNQARGEKVEVTLPAKHYGVADNQSLASGLLVAIQGTVLGVEAKPASGKETVEVLNLWCVDGMRAIPLAEVQRVKFLNPAVENEVNRALEVLARGLDTQKKAVSLQFDGNGKRAVRVGYVVETPLWRTSYRLLVGKDGKLFVQGWAMVVNPTNEDWKDVRMALVSGRPISFKMDLYQPLYVPRPVVQPEIYASIKPTWHGQKELTGTSAVGGQFMAAGVTLSGSQAPVANVGYPFNSTSLGANQDFTKNALMRGTKDQDGSVGINLQNGIVSAALATDLGDSFQYAIEHAITIPRQKSALLPIVNQGLEGDKVSLYSPGAHAKYPLLALRLKNTTGLHLMQGPVSVFEGTGYCGDAQLPDLQPNEERLVSYALDLGTEVETVGGETGREMLSISLKKGTLSLAVKLREAKTYTLKNRSPHDRVVLVEHPYRAGFKLVSEATPKERARDVYRFEVPVAAGETAQLKVVEQQQVEQQVGLVHCTTDTIRQYLQFELSDPQVKVALEKLLVLRDKSTKTQQDLSVLQQQLRDITQDQARLRANLKEMPETAAAYKRYLEKFDNQETLIENLQEQIQELQTQARKQQQECDNYLFDLDLEATIRKAPVETR